MSIDSLIKKTLAVVNNCTTIDQLNTARNYVAQAGVQMSIAEFQSTTDVIEKKRNELIENEKASQRFPASDAVDGCVG